MVTVLLVLIIAFVTVTVLRRHAPPTDFVVSDRDRERQHQELVALHGHHCPDDSAKSVQFP